MRHAVDALNADIREATTPRQRKAEIAKRRDALTTIDDELDRAMGRMLRWANKVSELRAKRKRVIRDLAKTLATSA